MPTGYYQFENGSTTTTGMVPETTPGDFEGGAFPRILTTGVSPTFVDNVVSDPRVFGRAGVVDARSDVKAVDVSTPLILTYKCCERRGLFAVTPTVCLAALHLMKRPSRMMYWWLGITARSSSYPAIVLSCCGFASMICHNCCLWIHSAIRFLSQFSNKKQSLR